MRKEGEGEMIVVLCCRFCGIPIMPERVQETGTCESTGCAQLLEESRNPGPSKQLSGDEFSALLRIQGGKPAGGYRGQVS